MKNGDEGIGEDKNDDKDNGYTEGIADDKVVI